MADADGSQSTTVNDKPLTKNQKRHQKRKLKRAQGMVDAAATGVTGSQETVITVHRVKRKFHEGVEFASEASAIQASWPKRLFSFFRESNYLRSSSQTS